MDSINPKTLKGEALFYYLTKCIKDKEYSSIVSLLPYAVSDDMDKAYALLERVVKEGKQLVTVYPNLNEKPTPDMQYIGDIMDGGLYVK